VGGADTGGIGVPQASSHEDTNFIVSKASPDAYQFMFRVLAL
jgi:hypothetical protein